MRPDLFSYPVLQLRPGMLLAYDRIEWPRRVKLPGQDSPLSNFSKKKAYDGKLTECAKKRLKRAITLITAIAQPKTATVFKTGREFKFKLNFITLTLPAMQGEITDKQIIRDGLRLWLMKMKDTEKLKSYVWRAERQKNGNLHFHIITDTYIQYDRIRDSWNQTLNRFGFIDKFYDKYGHRHPNSTDVHAIKNVKNLAGYFIKYMTKGADSPDVINGKVWDCSANLKQKHNCELLIEQEEAKLIKQIDARPEIQRKDLERCTCWFLTYAQLKQLASPRHLQKYDEWLNSIRNPLPKNKKDTDFKTSEKLPTITQLHTAQFNSRIINQQDSDSTIFPLLQCPF